MPPAASATPPPLPGLVRAKFQAIGLWLAVASCVVPMVPLVFLMTILVVSRREPDRNLVQILFWTCQAIGGLCGVLALLGMWKWGHRTVWMLACIGLALGGFNIGMMFAGDAH